jgi:small-conductance mechanosensitive channel/CRP-like cAMP-binding protein
VTAQSAVQGALLEGALAFAIFIVLLLVGKWFKRRRSVRFGFGYVMFSLCLAVYLPMRFFDLEFPGREMAMRHIGALLIFFGTFVLVALLRRFVWEAAFEQKRGVPTPKFLSELMALLLFGVAAMLIITVSYGQSVSWLLGASGITAIVLGLALQDTLGNIIAGISIEVGKPYRVGDWLIVEEKRAEVIEVNWRSTRLRDNDGVYYDIPNKKMVGSTITNLTYPDRVHGIRLRVHFEYAAPPNTVKDCLQHAAQAAEGVLSQPPPRIFLRDFGDSGVVYEVRFWIEDESRYNPICDAVRTNIWYEAQRAELRIPFPIRIVRLEKERRDERGALDAARTSVRRQPFLQLLPAEQLDRLLSEARLLRFGRGERIIEQGDAGQSMFIVVRGQADVFLDVNGEQRYVTTLSDGDYCGEMSLLTGEPRTATVKARTDCEVWEVGKETLADVLAENRALLEQLSELLAKRKMEVEGIVAALGETERKETADRYKEGFLQRLYGFFEL